MIGPDECPAAMSERGLAGRGSAGMDGLRTEPGGVGFEERLIGSLYEAVADALGRDVDAEEIPIREMVDPEALAGLFNEHAGDTYVSFPLQDLRVVVYSDGDVLVQPTLQT